MQGYIGRHLHQKVVCLVMVVMLFATIFLYWECGIEHADQTGLFNVGFGVGALLASILLFYCCMMDGTHIDEEKRAFMAAVFLNFSAMSFNSLSYVVYGQARFRSIVVLTMPWVYALDGVTNWLIMEYIIRMLHLRGEVLVERFRKIALAMSVVCMVAGLSNYVYPVYFRFDEHANYIKGAFYDWNLFFPVFVPLLVIVLLVLYYKRLQPKQRAATIGYAVSTIVLTVLSGFVTHFFLNYAVILLVLFIMYILLNVESGNRSAVTERELDTAKRIQKSMIPNIFPDFVDVPEFDIYARMESAREVGGDFYDFFRLENSRFAFLVGDISGHGVGAALSMAVAKSMINMHTQLGGTPAQIMEHVNQRMIDMNTSGQGMTVRVWLGILDVRTGRMSYCNAGQNRQAIRLNRQGGAFAYETGAVDPPVGESAGSTFTDRELWLEPGDQIFLFTDGLVETAGRYGKRLGYEKVLECLNENHGKSNEELCSSIYQVVERHLEGVPQEDDITLLGFTFKKREEAA